MKIRACIVLDFPDKIDAAEAIDQLEATLQNGIENDDLQLYVDSEGEEISATDYKIVVEEVTE